MAFISRNIFLIILVTLVLFSVHAHAFGAGNIASISKIEGRNWRHGDIEDLLKQVTCIKHHKWNTMMIKRVYFGNWLRDYSQAMDTAALKKAQPETIRMLVWLLSFLGFGYATAEFEVTSERLGVYRPEEHIDNPKNYNDDQDARPYDSRLRAPVRPVELEIDHETGMKNYIANGKGDWATSLAFVKYSFTQSIHHGRLYTSGSGTFSKGKDEDLAEACRLLGQGLHCLEDFGAHTNYIELSLIELGHRNVFPMVGTNTQITLGGNHRVYPLVTGTFGAVDFYHSVIGEATDHFTQSELNEMDNAIGVAEQAANSSSPLTTLVKLLSKMPGTGGLVSEAQNLQAMSQVQAKRNLESSRGLDQGSSRDPSDYPGGHQYGAGSHSYNDYNQQQAGWNNYNQGQNYQQPNQGWNDNNQSQSYQQHNQWQQPPQPQWNQSSQWQQQQPQQHDQYQQHQQWQQPQQDNQWQHPSQQYSQYQQPQQQNQYQQHQQYDQYQQNQQPGQFQHNQQQGQFQHNQQQGQDQQHQQWQQQQAPSNDQWQQPGGHPTTSNPASVPNQPTTSQPPIDGHQILAPPGLEGMPNFNPAQTIKQIYPILVFRDKVVRSISEIIEKIPGLEALVERITETLTVFIFSLLAPFVRPVLSALQKTLQSSSEGLTESNKTHQYEIFDDPNCSDPTHSVLSKDHFSNILNEPAGQVAGEILKFIAPRVLYAWEHPEVPVERVMKDVESIFHHPALRDERGNECHRNMFAKVRQWTEHRRDFEPLLTMQAVRQGKNHIAGVDDHAGHGSNVNAQAGGHKPPGPGGYDYGAYLHSAENVIGGLTGHPGQHQSQSQSQGGFGGLLHQAESFMGGSHGGGGGGGGSSSFLHQAESFIGGGGGGHSSSSWLSGGGGGGSHGGGGGGGLGDMLSVANKIPGVGKYTSQLDNFNKISSFLGGGGRREIPGGERGFSDEQGGSSERGFHDDGDYGDSDQYRAFMGASVGGGSELYESALTADRAQPTPSPGPLPPPSGYEQYARGGEYHTQDEYDHGYFVGSSAYHHQQQQQQQQQYSYGGGSGGYGFQQY